VPNIHLRANSATCFPYILSLNSSLYVPGGEQFLSTDQETGANYFAKYIDFLDSKIQKLNCNISNLNSQTSHEYLKNGKYF
jgi:hypothetical protein